MEIVSHSKSENDIVTELTGFFDLLARFDFEDAQKEQRIPSQEIEKGSSLAYGEPFPASCESRQDTMSEDPSFQNNRG